jgi:hypothetical protein
MKSSRVILSRNTAVVATVISLVGQPLFAQSSTDSLARAFATPPDAAKPRTWWHWTRSNVTTEGITKDLEWMKRVGIGGVQFGGQAAPTLTESGLLGPVRVLMVAPQ